MPLRVYMAGALSDRAAPHVDSNRGEALVRNHNYAGLKGRLVAVAEMPQVYDKNSARRPERFCGRHVLGAGREIEGTAMTTAYLDLAAASRRPISR